MEVIGLSEDKIKTISSIENEEEWIRKYRLTSYQKFLELGMPLFGPKIDLDFEKIIFLSFNEGIFPADGEQTSCIPYFLRKHFNLPTYEDKDSISSYNFYRLIQRAKEVYMIYDSSTVGVRTQEESRFVKQLVYDFGIRPVYRDYKFPLPAVTESFDGDIVANQEDIDVLRKYFPGLETGEDKKELSSTSLNSYLDCQRKFFLTFLLDAGKDKELTDKVEANNFGDIFHWCMQHIYDSVLGNAQKITADGNLMAQVKNKVLNDEYLDNLIREAFISKMKVREIEGENLIIREAVRKYIHNTVSADYERAKVLPFTLCKNELEIKNRTGFPASLKGVIDRLEMQGEMPRICDYKTGMFVAVERKNPFKSLKQKGFEIMSLGTLSSPLLKLSDEDFDKLLEIVFSRESREKYHEILFQQLLYALLLCREWNYSGMVEIAIYQLKIIDRTGPIRILITASQLERYTERLNSLLEELKKKADGSSEPVFGICPDKVTCKNCDFNSYCRRVKENE